MPLHPTRRHAIGLRSTLINRAAMTSARAIAAQMAQDILQVVAAKGSVDAEDLQLAGWLQRQINAHGAAARERALAREVVEMPLGAAARRRLQVA